MLTRRLVPAITVATTLMWGVGFLFAQQQTEATGQRIWSGEYKPLTVWRQMVIGGAYYTDPGYVSNLQFTYGFNLKDIPPDVKGKIPALIKDGEVIPAIVNSKTGIAQTVKAGGLRDLETSTQAPTGTSGIILLSKSNNILGQPSSTNWVGYVNPAAKK
jgi:hypothetical protein